MKGLVVFEAFLYAISISNRLDFKYYLESHSSSSTDSISAIKYRISSIKSLILSVV